MVINLFLYIYVFIIFYFQNIYFSPLKKLIRTYEVPYNAVLCQRDIRKCTALANAVEVVL